MAQAALERMSLDGGDAEVWTWEKTISGVCRCGDECGTISVSVNGREVSAQRDGDRFYATLRLEEGENRIVAYCRDGDGSECGSEAMTLVQRLRPGPKARIAVSLEEAGIVLDGGGSEASESDGTAVVGYSWHPRKGNPEALVLERAEWGEGNTRVAVRPPKCDGEYYVALRVTDAKGRSDTATATFTVADGKARAADLERGNAAWVEEAVVYGVVPHNFGPDGFGSVTERLDELSDLGITAIWLSPCNVTPTGGHGYDVSNYFRVRRDYGTKSDFRRMVRQAHAKGIRVLMDIVPNHSAIGHRYMKHVQKHGKASAYYDFYDRDEQGDYTYYFNWEHLPNLNYDNPEVRRWMLEAFSYWVREFDMDGFRVDACWGVKQRRPDFWPEWRRELLRIKPDLLLIAEAGARDRYWFSDGFDAAYDWTDELGHWAWGQVFEDANSIVTRLNAALTNEGRGFHEDALICRFLNNNDTGPRFITRYGLGLTRVAAAMLLTVPGLPCVYTGQEAGAEFEPYATPGPISWEDKHGLRPHYARLISLRRSVPALHSRKWEIMEARSEGQTYAYARFAGDGGEPVLVVLNFSATETEAEVKLTEATRMFAGRGALMDLLGGEEVPVAAGGEGAIRVRLPASSAKILVLRSG